MFHTFMYNIKCRKIFHLTLFCHLHPIIILKILTFSTSVFSKTSKNITRLSRPQLHGFVIIQSVNRDKKISRFLSIKNAIL